MKRLSLCCQEANECCAKSARRKESAAGANEGQSQEVEQAADGRRGTVWHSVHECTFGDFVLAEQRVLGRGEGQEGCEAHDLAETLHLEDTVLDFLSELADVFRLGPFEQAKARRRLEEDVVYLRDMGVTIHPTAPAAASKLATSEGITRQAQRATQRNM